ncbi:hypothetical protein P6166_16750 [Stenotrophomonas sp. HITSZ_GD]|uniref:hypothetical protein n=1 Tax=Stenotrophomonas sp. HITSZ_GD TaxID=3037248 RepID=UPI00240DEFD8|nr:hypothetical protein [Stenotrophomonas sp. HITSZ_GD]MDG2527003.1 hypothetical protein [Stenotrophomonas sp. HITSZ_GD]
MALPLLGMLMLVCPHHCEVPLPGGALEVHAEATQWQWCVRVDATSPWRLCEDEWPLWMRERLHAALRRLQAGAPLENGPPQAA